MLHLTNCPVCSGTIAATKSVSRHRASHNGSVIECNFVECPCGHVFTNPQQEWRDLEPFYSTSYQQFDSVHLRDDAALDWFVANHQGDRISHVKIVPGGRYLDVGCGLGTMVRTMARFGMRSEGVEPSRIAAESARSKGATVTCSTLEEANYPDRTFDAVSLFEVIEHVPDPVATLKECGRILKPGGEVIISTPNYTSIVYRLVGSTWRGLDFPRHLHLFTAASMKVAADRANLSVADLTTESMLGAVETQMMQTLRRRAFVPYRLSERLHLMRPLARYLTKFGNASGRGEGIIAKLTV